MNLTKLKIKYNKLMKKLGLLIGLDWYYVVFALCPS
jgi:hypothetical protein